MICDGSSCAHNSSKFSNLNLVSVSNHEDSVGCSILGHSTTHFLYEPQSQKRIIPVFDRLPTPPFSSFFFKPKDRDRSTNVLAIASFLPQNRENAQGRNTNVTESPCNPTCSVFKRPLDSQHRDCRDALELEKLCAQQTTCLQSPYKGLAARSPLRRRRT
jgi:hypothetical protein